MVGNALQTDESRLDIYRLCANYYAVRTELLQNKKHLVVPVVMMVEGVHEGSAGALFHPAEELGKYPQSWNGIPISIHHPREGDDYISCNDPSVIDFQVVGRVFNTEFKDNALRAEAWLDEEALQRVSPETFHLIQQGRPLEVSVGVWTDDDPVAGVWNGEEYTAIARNHRPDHLALLPEGQGACSWADGCGVRANQECGCKKKVCSNTKGGETYQMKNVEELVVNALQYEGTEDTEWSAPTLSDFGMSSNRWSALSAEERAEVASHYLIGTAAAETFGDLKFPVVNPRTGKLNERALRAVIGGRGAQVSGVSAEQRAAARRRAYRLLNEEFDAGLEVPTSLEKRLYNDALQADEQGYREIENIIQTKLDAMDTDTKLHFLVEVFDGYFIYEVRPRSTETSVPSGAREPQLFRREYSVADDGTIEFEGEPKPVRRQVEYVAMEKREERTMKRTRTKSPASVQEKGGSEEVGANDKKKECPKCMEKVQALIAHELTQFTEDDKEWLVSLDESQLDRLMPLEAKAESALAANTASEDNADGDNKEDTGKPPVVTKEDAIKALEAHLADPDKFMKLLPPKIQESVRHGLELHEQVRQGYIDHITNNTEVYTEADLKDRSTEELKKLATAIKPLQDYSALSAGGRSLSDYAGGEILLPPGVEAD
jgi:hypothetical protein